MFCPQCAKPNDESAKFCTSCGSALVPTVPVVDEHAHEQELYKTFIGPNNTYYYLDRFQNFDRRGAGAAWHWPAFFLTFYWLLYRKMWGLAFLYYFVPYLLAALLAEFGSIAGGAVQLILSLAYLGGLVLAPPLYANALYYRHCKKKIAAIKASTSDPQRQLGLASGRGGTSMVLLLLLGSFFFVAIIGILAAIALPAYADYTNRAKVSEAVSLGKKAATAVENYQHQYGSTPASLKEAGFEGLGLLPPHVTDIELNRQTGAVEVAVKVTAFEGSVSIVPTRDTQAHISWGCSSEDIANKYLPKECRSETAD